MQNKRKSTIKKLDLAKGIIIIEKIDKDQPNDFLCTKEFYQKSLSEEKLKVLNEGDEVTFKAINKGNKFYAQDIQVIKFKKLSLSGKST
ncbi:hypothetical protein, partial [Gallibacterium anatis]|uniref:hypothetical protein n=2 Tax=Pasteurellaceae TaxID=712 RepID=UPI000BD41D5B